VAKHGIDRFISRQEWMDGWAERVQKIVGAIFRGLGGLGRALKNILNGTWVLHHPLHPALTDIPLGAWITGVLADYLAISTNLVGRQAGTIALAVGLVGAAGAALTGYTDFVDLYGMERRTALAHGLTMTIVSIIQTTSFILRLVNAYPVAVGLSTAGLVLTMFGMFIGGHVVYRYGTRVDRTAFLTAPDDFVKVGAPSDFPEGQLRRVDANGLPVLLVRRDSTLHAIVNVCSHAGGPLNEGALDGDVVQCPWHGSRFSIRDGAVRAGPATFSQPRLEIRERDGAVEVRLEEPLR
jgi:nitrite reductase/ring-hydroxylating ferredoxin subunit